MDMHDLPEKDGGILNTYCHYIYDIAKQYKVLGVEDLPYYLKKLLDNNSGFTAEDYNKFSKLLFILESELIEKGITVEDIRSKFHYFYRACESRLGREVFGIGETVYLNKNVIGASVDSSFPKGLQGTVTPSQFIADEGQVVVRFELAESGDVVNVDPDDKTPIPISKTIRAYAFKIKAEDLSRIKPETSQNSN